MKSLVVATALAVSLSACATTTMPPYHITTPYQPELHLIRDGSNTIQGNALLRTVGGEVRTCAGFEVKLTPVTAYSTERIRAIYGDDTRGYRHSYEAGRDFTPVNSHYDHEAGRGGICDSQGDFEFRDIADGDYYVVTQVLWQVPSQYITMTQGGVLMQKVSVQGGETERVVLTQ